MIIFRADGNSSVGLGHVMRCLSIADALKRVNENCMFITADDGLCDTIVSRGHQSHVLGSLYNQMEEESDGLTDVICRYDVAAIFVDSYYVTERYLKNLKEVCSRNSIVLVYIDDVLAFPYPCDILLNYNIYANKEAYKDLYADEDLPGLLIKTSYMPVRAEFQNLKDRFVRSKAEDILISTGGADAECISVQIIRTIVGHSEWNHYRFHFIIGMMNENKDSIIGLANGDDRIILYEQVNNMSELMQRCDVAISAAGSTLYELCATQTPSITYILEDNQAPGAQGFEDEGVLKCAGDLRESGVDILVDKMLSEAINLADSYEERVSIAAKMKKVIDGKGAERIAQEIIRICVKPDVLNDTIE